MIYEEYEKRYQSVVYPDRKSLDKVAYNDARSQYGIEVQIVNESFREGLAKEYGLVGNPKEKKVWELAWSEGHSSGYSTVEQYYDQFSELVRY